MLTYSRKKTENLIEGVQNLCRLCLGNLEDPVQLFSDEKVVYTSLSFRIMLSAGIELSYDQSLSNAICKHCYDQVQSCYEFRKKCQSSYCKLKSHLQALKLKACESYKLEDTCKAEKLVLNFENDELTVIEENSITQVADQIYSENQIQECKQTVAVDEEKIVILQPFADQPNDIEESQKVEAVDHEKVEVLEKLIDEQVEIVGGKTESTSFTVIEEGEPSPDFDIASFLTTVLVQLGVLEKYEDFLELTNGAITSLELQTNEDNIINLEIVEEEDDANEEDQIEEEPADKTEPVSNADQNIVIQFVTGNCSNKYVQKAPDEMSESDAEEKDDKSTEDNSVGEMSGVVSRVKAVCSYCGKNFSSKSSLRRHLQVHTGEKPFICKVCGKGFNQAAILKRHRLTHLERRPFKCERCEKSFTQRSGLVAHARAHQPPHKRPLLLHKCPHCDKVFLYASGLSRHVPVHNGRLFMCVGCEKRFNDKSSLLRHFKTCKKQNKTHLGRSRHFSGHITY